MDGFKTAHVFVAALVCSAVLACSGGDSQRIQAVEAFAGRVFDRPIEVGVYPAGELFVAEQVGLVMALAADGSNSRTLLDLRGRVDAESGEGLLSFALDPEFAANGHVWAYYFAADASQTVLARFGVRNGTAPVDTELRVLVLDQPGFNQNGGAIRFGPDGMLYLSLGDGSASQDPFENGQDLGTLLGAIVRIDVRASSPAAPYATPSDNPFLGREGARPEIWAYGLRNPWRMAFDPDSGELWAGDVGVSDFEELNLIARGGNYGWNFFEGFRCRVDEETCSNGDFIPPAAVYSHDSDRCAVVGGLVYVGESLPGLRGKFVFADFCSGEVFALETATLEIETVTRIEGGVTSFGVDAAGEVLLTSPEGKIWRLTPG